MSDPLDAVVHKWHEFLRGERPDALEELLDDDVVFYSPIVFSPQKGKAVTALYLFAATQALPGDVPDPDGPGEAGEAGARADGIPGRSFRYTKQVLSGDTAVLEFETTIDGLYVNGVDIIRCDGEGRIVEFRVMIRPLQAVNLVHRQMAAMLDALRSGDGAAADT